MTSNEDAEIRKHVYKPLKRGSPTPLYYPLAHRQSATRHRGVRDTHGPARGPGAAGRVVWCTPGWDRSSENVTI